MPRGFRYALIVTAMAFAWIAGHAAPLQAAPQGDAVASTAKPLALGKFTKHRKKHTRHHVRSSRKNHASAKTSSKADRGDDAKNDAKTATEAKTDASLSPSVANAHAELTGPAQEQPAVVQNNAAESSTLTDTDKAVAAEPAPNGVEVTTSDQLNDMDRDAAATPAATPEPATVALAQISPPTAATASEDSAWGSASLIGKIFIAFGVMLTLASAARMIIA